MERPGHLDRRLRWRRRQLGTRHSGSQHLYADDDQHRRRLIVIFLAKLVGAKLCSFNVLYSGKWHSFWWQSSQQIAELTVLLQKFGLFCVLFVSFSGVVLVVEVKKSQVCCSAFLSLSLSLSLHFQAAYRNVCNFKRHRGEWVSKTRSFCLLFKQPWP